MFSWFSRTVFFFHAKNPLGDVESGKYLFSFPVGPPPGLPVRSEIIIYLFPLKDGE
jgi:hypothetical protein